MSRNKLGFSLIELLVVVAIIGILAAVGVVGYQGYIDATKDTATEANMAQVARAINVDTVAIRENLDGSTDLNKGLTKASLCITQVETIVNQLNVVEAGRNPFDEQCYKAFNGNRLWSHNFDSPTPSGQHGIGQTTTGNGCGFVPPEDASTTVIVPRGTVMVACTDAQAEISSNAFKIYTCACTGSERCITTDTVAACASDADPAKCRRDYMANNPTECPTPGDDYLMNP